MGCAAKALHVSDVLHLNGSLPGWSHDDLAAETFIIDRLAPEQAREHVVQDALGHRGGP
jgi:hypothetical protein